MSHLRHRTIFENKKKLCPICATVQFLKIKKSYVPFAQPYNLQNQQKIFLKLKKVFKKVKKVFKKS